MSRVKPWTHAAAEVLAASAAREVGFLTGWLAAKLGGWAHLVAGCPVKGRRVGQGL